MLEKYVRPGDLIIGTDSHTCTYGAVGAFATGVGSTDGAAAIATGRIWLKVPETVRVELRGSLRAHVTPKDAMLHIVGTLGADGATYQTLLFTGPGAASIDHAGRCTMCNMAIEAGAKAGMFEPDEVTAAFLASSGRGGELVSTDADAEFSRTLTVDLDRLDPQVSRPWSVDSVVTVSEAIGTRIDQAFIGSCTNGRIEDLRAASAILSSAHVHRNVRLLVTPASQEVYRQALAEGVIEALVDSGAIICNPGCSACFGGQGMLWEGEVCIGTHNRNFRGRMGHANSRVYLASPETVAVSAIAGEITDPRSFQGGI